VRKVGGCNESFRGQTASSTRDSPDAGRASSVSTRHGWRVHRVVVIGVAGCGKSTIGAAIAARLDVPYVDADDLHTDASVAKMASGEPLSDADRWPWLARVQGVLRRPDGVVVACSALARRYRDLLRHADGVRFVFLDVDAATAERRSAGRVGHYMGSRMVASQFDVLERPTGAEPDVVTIDATADVEAVVTAAVDALERSTPGTGA